MCARLQSITLSLCSISNFSFSTTPPKSPSPSLSNPFNKSTPTKSKLKIIDKTAINHDSYLYKLKWAGPTFPLTIGQHFRIIETIPTK